ncbi:hypothetical protein IAU60_006559 [Kwoniella sp. DSM 27419]
MADAGTSYGAGSAVAPSSPPVDSSTIYSAIHSLTLAQSRRNLNFTHLHPYAPLSSNGGLPANKGKGKSGALGDDEQILRELREAVGRIKDVLGRSADLQLAEGQSATGQGGDAARLVRALKEIETHQTALSAAVTPLRLLTSLVQDTRSNSTTLFLSPLLRLSPIALLQELSTSLGLQAFIEDSQFGLLKSSLAIAGGRVVVDVDLEMDTLGGEEDDEDAPTAIAAGSSASLPASINATGGSAERGKVRLAKLQANHVTSSGDTGKSKHLTAVLRARLESYLELWNMGEGGDLWQRSKSMEQLRGALEELKRLDDVAEAYTGEGETAVDWFDMLEQGAVAIDGLKAASSTIKVYSTETDGIFPTFHLLPRSHGGPEYNPVFRLRPSSLHEDVATPDLSQIGGTGHDTDINAEWSQGPWVLQVVPDGHDGLVVRKDWLVQGQAAVSGNPIKVENLLYQPFPNSTFVPGAQGQYQPFPYMSTFVHSSATVGPDQESAEAQTGGERQQPRQEQHWSMAQPGPAAYILARIGVPRSLDGLQKLMSALRKQVVLNGLFTQIFDVKTLETEVARDGEYEEEDLDDMLDGPQNIVPITVSLLNSAVDVMFPLIASGVVENVHMRMMPSDEEDKGYVQFETEGGGKVPASMEGSKVHRDLVKTMSMVLSAVE